MKEKQLLKIALICSLVGLILLFFISEKIQIDEVSISRIDEIEEDSSVIVKGKIVGVNSLEKVIYLEIAEEKIESVSVMLFKDSEIGFYEGQHIEIEGTVTTYEGEKEIIANKVKII